MNFYLGNSISNIKISDKNVEFCDELIDYIYDIRIDASQDLSELYNIDPYSDVEISISKVEKIVSICKYLLESNLLSNYDDYDEAILQIRDLIDIGKEAVKERVGIISIGD
ncbi:hypothetical protein NL50_09385 [Clostridium acetobutylicum]|nr:hypothetical protein NL50_09385 [Clostridium acetobutylicum]